MMSESSEAASLRWLANMFPYTSSPSDETDKMCNAIHVYCTAGADKIDELSSEVESLKNKFDFLGVKIIV